VTTVGLRNMTGVLDGNNVTIYATTSTSSTSGDRARTRKVVVGPTYGTVYRGVAFVN
jgi:hypothetical protein